jgi:hypothetical protein
VFCLGGNANPLAGDKIPLARQKWPYARSSCETKLLHARQNFFMRDKKIFMLNKNKSSCETKKTFSRDMYVIGARQNILVSNGF